MKKAECRRIDAFELWCWRRLLRVPWTARRSNQSILKVISPGYSLEGLMLKLKLQYLATSCKELTHWERLWCWEGFGAGGEGDDKWWDGWIASLTPRTWVLVNSGRWWWTGRPGILWFMGSQRVRHNWATELNWIDAFNIGAWQYVRQILTSMKGEINNNIVIVGDINTLLTPVGSHVRHYWQNGGMVPGPLPSFRRHGPRMKDLGPVILTCFSSPQLSWLKRNIKVLNCSWEEHENAQSLLQLCSENNS